MEIFQVLEEKSKTHPNICNFWKKYLLNKLKNINDDLEHCKSALQLMETNPDIEYELVLLLYNLNLNIIPT
jgi:hypothetical protein